MSYTLEFWAASVDGLVDGLGKGEAGAGPEKVAERAAALLGEDGEYIDSVSHSSSGGDWFRDEFIEGTVAGLIGREAAVALLDRELAGTRWDGYPSMGWLTKAELAGAVARLDQAGDDALTGLDDEDAEELLEPLVDILRAVAATGKDLVAVYS